MDIETLKPTFLITIEGKTLSKDITQEITSLTFEDNEEELDVLELSITDRNLQFVDDPLFQEGNEVTARFGYVGNLSPRKVAVIKDIDYDFPESGDPTTDAAAFAAVTPGTTSTAISAPSCSSTSRTMPAIPYTPASPPETIAT